MAMRCWTGVVKSTGFGGYISDAAAARIVKTRIAAATSRSKTMLRDRRAAHSGQVDWRLTLGKLDMERPSVMEE